jgi:hypothetical protein
VLIVGYGMTDSFDGPAGLPQFQQGLRRLLDDVAGSGTRLVILAPIAHENLGSPLPDPSRHNHDLALYRAVLHEAARQRGAWYIDPSAKLAAGLTEDGIHLSGAGYERLASIVAEVLGGGPITLSDADRARFQALRAAVVAKNRLYFYRWRPQNETYLFGFRKHEQGNNAREIPLFDPLVAAKEEEIARLKRQPAPNGEPNRPREEAR